jgi:hypothetical protein
MDSCVRRKDVLVDSFKPDTTTNRDNMVQHLKNLSSSRSHRSDHNSQESKQQQRAKQPEHQRTTAENETTTRTASSNKRFNSN